MAIKETQGEYIMEITRKRFFTIGALALAVLVSAYTRTSAEPRSSISIELSASKSEYKNNEPIEMRIRIYNCDQPLKCNTRCLKGSKIATQPGFFDRDWTRQIRFTAPDKTIVRSKRALKMYEKSTGVFRVDGRLATQVEIVKPGIIKEFKINDARELYDLSKPGKWTAQIIVPLQVFHYRKVDNPGDEGFEYYGFLPAKAKYRSITSKKVKFEILKP
jgi:hypothetical protein